MALNSQKVELEEKKEDKDVVKELPKNMNKGNSKIISHQITRQLTTFERKRDSDDDLVESDIEDSQEDVEENKDKVVSDLPMVKKHSTLLKSKTYIEPVRNQELKFDVMDDPDYPAEAVNSNIIVEQIEVNGCVQKIIKKTYYMIDGTTKNITRMEQA